ncbi:serine/threonine-protein kinase [Streptomyces sp. MST-110588]|uniref:serine/threonine-protein kinase n=1 Tax=Streptomyces sp. MST-110588 TaxID=2833628 RepID=UPI001F5D1FF5|nr:serine/threonine-protein kinase [Streptomyces sp. MST-110588]UNO40349.1 serine/threonine protein kinase [Streptomyces sp. MST-110588]
MTNDGGRAHEPTIHATTPPTEGVPEPTKVATLGVPVPLAGGSDSPGGPDDREAPDGREAPGDDGRLIGGRYRLRSRLGHGGMGTVWEAHDEAMDRVVALKEPRLSGHLTPEQTRVAYRRMRREARAAARIDHPSVVAVHDVVDEDGRPWIVMELVRGESLADRLLEGTLDPREAARIGLAVLGALTAAHGAGVLHRDVKPGNVLLGRGDRVVLTDFGIAQVEGEQGLTETGTFVGSPEYTAPERLLGQRPGPGSDLWSLGVVLYLAVEGVSPFRRSHAPATMQAVLSAEPQPPVRAAGPLGEVVMRLLSKDPAARPDAAGVRRELERVAEPDHGPARDTAARDTAARGRTAGRTAVRGAAAGRVKRARSALPRTRKVQLGLTAAVLVLATALVVVLARPFDGDKLPPHWVVRQEGEVVRASLAVPDDYRRTVGPDDGYVTFDDPSGVFSIDLSLERDGVSALPDEAEELVTYYKEGGDDGTEVSHARSVKRPATQQGRPAMEVDTTYLPYEPDEDAVRYRKRQHVYVDAEKKSAWVLTVTMPAKGEARRDGDELFTNVVKFLDLQE